ncbi:MAG: Isoleucine-tRNA ligase, partial [Parcubacteria group bacterium GW2011_GWF2_46_8]
RIEGDSPLPEGGSRGVGEAPSFPADYISEAIDQTRGWFYTLLAVSVLLGKEAPYKNVICLGHVLDAKGKKMSKSIGNVINPVEVIDQYGADAVRWYMYTVNQPGDPKRFDLKALDEMVKKVFLILWNVLSFYELYAQNQGKTEISVPSIHILDRWVLTRLHTLVRDATADLESYKVTEPARAIGEFVSDLSTWYVRRSRDRFKGQDKADKTAALATLRTCLLTLSKLLAPFTPFLAEALYQRLSGGKRSVHLEDWPQADVSMMDETILRDMGQGRSVISRLLEKRAAAGIPVRQALARAIVVVPEGTLGEEFIGLIKDEVNVKEIKVVDTMPESDTVKILSQEGVVVGFDITETDELRLEGEERGYIRNYNALRKKNGFSPGDKAKICEPKTPELEKFYRDSGRLARIQGATNSTITLVDGIEAIAIEKINP